MVWGIATTGTSRRSRLICARIAQAAGGVLLLGGIGISCNALWGLGDLDYRAGAEDAGSDAEAGSCEGSLTCYGLQGQIGEAPCNATGRRVAECDPQAAWLYCDCDALDQLALFIEPPAATGDMLDSVVLLAPESNQPYSLQIDTSCRGAATSGGCDLEDACVELGGMGYRLYRWSDFSGTTVHEPGDHVLAIRGGDTLCSSQVIMSFTYDAPEIPDAGPDAGSDAAPDAETDAG